MFIKPKGLIFLFIFFLIFFTIGLFVGFKLPPLNKNNLINDRIYYDSFADTNEFPNIISNEVDTLINSEKDSIISLDSVNNIDSVISLIDDSTEYIYDNIDTVLSSEDNFSDQDVEIIDTVRIIETVDTSDFIDTVDTSLDNIDTGYTVEIYDTFIDTTKDSVELILNPLDTLDEF